jgi:hypothetical protein
VTVVHVQSIKVSCKALECSIVCVYSDKLSGQSCVALGTEWQNSSMV